jgi:hypothetical protein
LSTHEWIKTVVKAGAALYAVVFLGVVLLVAAFFVIKNFRQTDASELPDAPQTRHVIAILPLADPPDGNVGVQLRTVVASALLSHKQKNLFSVVDTTFIDRIIEQHQFEASDWSDPNKAAEAGRALNADIVGIIDYKRTGKLLWQTGNCSVNFLDINTMVVVGAVALSDKREADYLSDGGDLASAVKYRIKFEF